MSDKKNSVEFMVVRHRKADQQRSHSAKAFLTVSLHPVASQIHDNMLKIMLAIIECTNSM